MLMSIRWWRCGITVLASATTVRSSSRLSEVVLAFSREIPSRRSTPFASRFVVHTTG
jgi:hypothetical protein